MLPVPHPLDDRASEGVVVALERPHVLVALVEPEAFVSLHQSRAPDDVGEHHCDELTVEPLTHGCSVGALGGTEASAHAHDIAVFVSGPRAGGRRREMVAAMNRVVGTDNADMAQRTGANVRDFGQVGCASDHSAETGSQSERHRARTTTISPAPNRLDERGFQGSWDRE
jgi:hypothetical protein